MEAQTELFHIERINNESLVPPPNQTDIDVEIVKEQILNLNDKFDYLLYVMMKNQKLGPSQSADGYTLDKD